jgi:hypothetical protein
MNLVGSPPVLDNVQVTLTGSHLPPLASNGSVLNDYQSESGSSGKIIHCVAVRCD